MTATAVVSPLTTGSESVLPTPASTISAVVGRAVELDLGGNIHDALIAQVCAEHDLPLVTLDGRRHRLALALGARSTHLLA
jgi:predicted nucleic acid-binding protein